MQSIWYSKAHSINLFDKEIKPRARIQLLNEHTKIEKSVPLQQCSRKGNVFKNEWKYYEIKTIVLGARDLPGDEI